MKEAINNFLTAQGFSAGNQPRDFGYVIPYVDYWQRKLANGQWQYVSIIYYDGQFTEAVLEIFKSEKNTRDKKQEAVGKMLYRDIEKLKEKILE